MSNSRPYRLGALAYVIDKDNNLLLVQLNSYKNTEWNLPGGGRKNSESGLQNIHRELQEELNIEPSSLTLLGESKKPLQYDFPSSILENKEPIAIKYRGQQKDQFVFRCTNSSTPTIKLFVDELKGYKWCPISELKDHLVFPGQYQEAMRVLAEFQIDNSTERPRV